MKFPISTRTTVWYIILSWGVILSGSGTLRAEPMVYDGFDYAVGDLPGKDGGAGWEGSWTGGGIQVVSPGLDYTGLDVVGNTSQTGIGEATFREMPAGF